MNTKEQLLIYLKADRGNWVSGQWLSQRMAVSRTAIWKHIVKLREEGYHIESSPKRGYLLREPSQLLLPHEIREGLETRIFGRKEIVHFREIDSTNRAAKDLAIEGAPEGTLVIAERQTKGRGRRGRNWFSPSHKGIYMSFILRPSMSPIEAPRITLMTAVAVAEALLSLTPLRIHIKWPNDILINGRKLAGILTEISTEMDVINYVVVGLGLNVNTSTFPVPLREKATSVLLETGKPFPRVRLLRDFLKWFERYYELLDRDGFQPILRRWKSLTQMIGHQIQVRVLDDEYRGKVLDVDMSGALILEGNDGKSQRIFSGDVTLI